MRIREKVCKTMNAVRIIFLQMIIGLLPRHGQLRDKQCKKGKENDSR